MNKSYFTFSLEEKAIFKTMIEGNKKPGEIATFFKRKYGKIIAVSTIYQHRYIDKQGNVRFII